MPASRLAIIPNLICVARILLTLPILHYLINLEFRIALVLIMIAGFSDGLDGYLARHYGWTSRIGGLLDPLADKLLFVCVFAGTDLGRARAAVVVRGGYQSRHCDRRWRRGL